MQAARQHVCLAVACAVFKLAAARQNGHATKSSPSRVGHSLVADTGAQPELLAKEEPHTIFKMPNYHHADSLSAATDGYLDWFVVIYWGTIILFVFFVEVMTRLRGGVPITHIEVSHAPGSSRSATGSSRKQTPRPTDLGRGILSRGADERQHAHQPTAVAAGIVGSAPASKVPHRQDTMTLLGPEDAPGRFKELAPNVWALNLVASRGKALDYRGNVLSPKLVFVACLIMGFLQIVTLFLVMYDIDPAARPYTETPAAPWKKSPWTVNTMKLVMVFFLGMYVVSEAADAYDNFIIGMGVKNEDLLVPRCMVLFIPCFHYLITLSVILAGVSVVLSCQDVPNILYNSMAILFITQVDELFWGFFARTFDIDAEWGVFINESEVPEVQLLKKCLIMFPMCWGFGLLGRAWYRDQMPAQVFRTYLRR